MEPTQIKEELHEFIEHADERVLNLFYGMMKADNEALLTTGQQKELEKRIASHKKGESKSYRWAQARKEIENRA